MEEDRKGEKHQWWSSLMHTKLGTSPATQACALTGNQTSDPLVRRLVLNPLRHITQGPILYLFNYLSVRTHGYLLYFIGFNLTYYYLFCCSNGFSCGHWKLL